MGQEVRVPHHVHYEILDSEDDVGPVLVPRSSWSGECALRLSLGDIAALRLTESSGFCDTDLTSLRVAKLHWAKGMEGLLSVPTLQYLNIVNFPYSDLVPLSELTRLRRLSLVSRTLASLDGIERCSQLEHFDLFRCPELESLDVLAKCPRIKRVEVESCRHLPDRH
jgi:Leucine-rich repeat (LRR) protein